MQTPFGELVRILILLSLTFAATVFGSFWVWALLCAVSWTIFATVRANIREA